MKMKTLWNAAAGVLRGDVHFDLEGSDKLRRIPINVAEVRQVGADEDRTLRFVGTDETPDRYNSVVKADGWNFDDFVKNPVFLWAHDSNSPPIGKVVQIGTDEVERSIKIKGETKTIKTKRVLFDVQFASRDTYPFADVVYKLYKGGFMRGTSVGFQPTKERRLDNERDADEIESLGLLPGGPGVASPIVYDKNDLWELSGCPVPGNQNALMQNGALIEQLSALAPVQCRSSIEAKTFDVPEGNYKEGEITALWLTKKLEEVRLALDVERQEEEEEEEKEEDEEKDARAHNKNETSKDETDGHVHAVPELDEEGNGKTEPASGDETPEHDHDIEGFEVQDREAEDGSYVSKHLGSLKVEEDARQEDEEEEDEDKEDKDVRNPAEVAGKLADASTWLDNAIEFLEPQIPDEEKPEEGEGDEVPVEPKKEDARQEDEEEEEEEEEEDKEDKKRNLGEVVQMLKDTRDVVAEAQALLESMVPSEEEVEEAKQTDEDEEEEDDDKKYTNAQVIKILKAARNQFAACLNGLAKRSDLQAFELRLEDMNQELRELRKGRTVRIAGPGKARTPAKPKNEANNVLALALQENEEYLLKTKRALKGTEK